MEKKRFRIYSIDSYESHSVVNSISKLNEIINITIFSDDIPIKIKETGNLNKAVIKKMKNFYKDKYQFYTNSLTKRIYNL